MGDVSSCPRVLFVDDDESVRRAFTRSMSARGYEVVLASSAEEALRTADHQGPFPVVVTDLNLPGLDGVELIQRMRHHHPRTAFVVMTGVVDVDLSRHQHAGAPIASIVPKPFDAEHVHQVIKRAVRIATSPVVTRTAEAGVAPSGGALILEDNPGDALLVQTQLEKAGWTPQDITHVRRLDDALAAVHDQPFEIVLSDLSLPDARGLDAVARLHAAVPRVPIIVLSGHDDDQVALEALQLGAQDYLVKSLLNATTLCRSVRHAIERKRVERRLAHLAHHDQLTGLANRTSFRERVTHALARARRRQEPFAVLLLDLDKFKAVNDNMGHEAGDILLQTVSGRLCQAVRDTDTVARLGGDEFAVLLDAPTGKLDAVAIAERILDGLREPAQLKDERFVITSSVGVAVYPEGGEDLDALVAAADAAMYEAKRSGRNTIRVYSREGTATTQLRQTLEHDLYRALAEDEFALRYQPQFDLRTGGIRGVEALLRWKRPGRLATPQDFLTVLEETGLIHEVGRWVLSTACQTLAQCPSQELRLAVNLTTSQFEDDDFVDTVAATLAHHRIAPHRLDLEITESILMRDTKRTNAALQRLKQLGVRLVIDDFGTGHSSLAYLTRFDVDALKVDRSFVHKLTQTMDSDRKVAAAIIALAHNLGLEVIAEGIETQEQLDLLRLDGCDLGQGYLLGRPDQAATWLDAPQKALPAPAAAPTPDAPRPLHHVTNR